MDDKRAIELLLGTAQEAAESIGATLGAGEDWDTIAIVASEDALVSVIKLPFSNPEEKEEVLFRAFPDALMRSRARAVVLALPSWLSQARGKMPDVMPSEDPERQEILMLLGITAKHVETRIAEVRREKGKPQLGGWQAAEDIFGGQTSQMGGAIVEMVVAALSGVEASRN